MKRPTGRLSTALLALCLTAGLCATDAAGQKPTAPRTQPLTHIFYDGEMAPLLAKLAQEFGVNVGLEFNTGQWKIKVKLDLENPTFPDVLNAVVNSAKGYEWRKTGGAFEVSPVGGDSPLLDTPISSFRAGDVNEAEAVDLLMNLPEVRAALGGMNLQYRSSGGARSQRGAEKISFNLEGVSLRQALHKIAERGGRFWAFRRYDKGPEGEFITIDTAR